MIVGYELTHKWGLPNIRQSGSDRSSKWLFTIRRRLAFVCLFISTVSQKPLKLGSLNPTEMVHHESWIYFGIKRSTVKVKRHK